MQTINCYIPLKMRLGGELSEDDWAAFEDALVATYKRVIERSLSELSRSGFINTEIGEITHVGINNVDLASDSGMPGSL